MSSVASIVACGVGGLVAIGAEVATVFAGKFSFKNAKISGMCCVGDQIKKLDWPCSTVNMTASERSDYCDKIDEPDRVTSLLPIAVPLAFAGVAYVIARTYIKSHQSEENNVLLPKDSPASSLLVKKMAAVCTSLPARVGYATAAVIASLASEVTFWGAGMTAEAVGECAGGCLVALQRYAEWDAAYTITTIAAPIAIAAWVAANTYNKLKTEPPSAPISNPIAEQL